MTCRLLQVSRSGYYAWCTREDSARVKRDRELVPLVRALHRESRGVYGARKIHRDLIEMGEACGRHKVARLMRDAGLKGCPKRRFRYRPGDKASYPVAVNLIQQDFTASKANERWSSDITFIWTRQGWLYLAVVMDLYSRRIVGWSMDRRISRHLVLDALTMALGHRRPVGPLLLHSDRGVQYTSDDYRGMLLKHGIDCSMSARGSCYDNAVVESFFASLKRERTKRARYQSRDEARADIFNYIECFYNRKRRHGYLGYISPVAFEERTVGLNETVR